MREEEEDEEEEEGCSVSRRDECDTKTLRGGRLPFSSRVKNLHPRIDLVASLASSVASPSASRRRSWSVYSLSGGPPGAPGGRNRSYPSFAILSAASFARLSRTIFSFSISAASSFADFSGTSSSSFFLGARGARCGFRSGSSSSSSSLSLSEPDASSPSSSSSELFGGSSPGTPRSLLAGFSRSTSSSESSSSDESESSALDARHLPPIFGSSPPPPPPRPPPRPPPLPLYPLPILRSSRVCGPCLVLRRARGKSGRGGGTTLI
ncbi:uncharacterized protein MICPUCDRAFT_69190 [Micromonas pusilla CCMP1545]|uniref:Predicted protein n=1 Tax=Micromonas pusilla (strain CCMP1545) TaxID=564608 RepID=C1MXS3_MICPC|nr:uncharacterized protein MICPUCDRAFT_69190 [Micromonas pusilla CCMP1545]EEH55511.1 predicted protein [Micromonas pusilla CCMP1545]|eukprot:XP_003060742.1 predicted protein [Micromonas pusilla CCMP1545]